MAPPFEWVENTFLTSVLPVGHNATKNILFRIASILLQFTVLKIFAYIACRLSAYTSFLMLAEDIIQKFYFLWSRGIDRQTWIVVVFVILFPAAGLYDTWLWTLDAPGYIVKSSLVNPVSFSRNLLPNPAYVITIPGNATQLDIELPLSANLYTQGTNISLIETRIPLTREVVPPLQKLSTYVEPRLWLDNEGWSVGSDLSWPALLTGVYCYPNTTNEMQQIWGCHLNNTNAIPLLERSVGEPKIWWDNRSNQYDFLVPFVKENVWNSLGPNGNSVIMKQIFTLTKGRRRHTLLETVWKVTMLTSPLVPFAEHEVLDVIRRMWSGDPDQVVNPDIKSISDQVMLAQTRGNSLSIGISIQQPFTIQVATVEYLTVLKPLSVSDQLFSVFRIRTSNITLLRSETLPPNSIIQPFAPCSIPYANLATGGRVRDTTCTRRMITSPRRPNNPDDAIENPIDDPIDGLFKGQIDASTMVILTDIIGNGNTNTSESVLATQGLKWILKNERRLDGLITTRALILGGDCDIVKIGHQKLEAAISRLQLILTLVPVVLAIFAFVLMSGNSSSHYKNSFLAAVCATTHVSDNSCRQIGYLKKPPLFTLKKVRRHVVIGTPNGGTLVNVGQDQVVAYSMVTEPLDLVPSAPTNNAVKDEEREQETLPMLSPLRRNPITSGT